MLSAYENKTKASFGIDAKATAEVLRRLADMIDPPNSEDRMVLGLTSVRVHTTCNRENYAMTTLRLTFHELKGEQPTKEGTSVALNGANQWPDDVARIQQSTGHGEPC